MVFAVVYALVVPLALGLAANWTRLGPFFRDQAAAAWAQGLLTVVAVAVTAWISSDQWRRELNRRKFEFASRVNDIIDIVQYTRMSSAPFRTAVSDSDVGNIFSSIDTWKSSEAQEVLNRLLDMPIANWPSPITYLRLRRYATALELLFTMADRYAPTIHGTDKQANFRHLLQRTGAVEEAERQALGNLGGLEFVEG